MVKIKSSQEISQNYEAGISRAPEKYKKGVTKTTDWQEKASSESAEERYSEGVQKAISAKLRQKRLQGVSNQDWQSRAADVGSTRIGPGMRANAGKRTKNFEPYRNFIEGVSLPEKTTDAEQNVMNRVVPIAKGMQELKRSGASV